MHSDVLEVVATDQGSVCAAGCGAAIAADQRYCLHCGGAQEEPRVPYRELIGPALASPGAIGHAPPPAPAAAVAAERVVVPVRDWTAVIALGGLAALALVLVVGVLIGKSESRPQPAAVAPQVITIASPAAGASTTPAAAATTTGAGSGGSGGSGAAAHGGGKAKATPKSVTDLSSSTGAAYQKKSSKLPTTVALPGKPPPKDHKAAGGGSSAQTIG